MLARGSEFEGFNLLLIHANENFEQAGLGLLLCEDCQFIAQVPELLCIKPRHFGLWTRIRLHKRPTPDWAQRWVCNATTK